MTHQKLVRILWIAGGIILGAVVAALAIGAIMFNNLVNSLH